MRRRLSVDLPIDGFGILISSRCKAVIQRIVADGPSNVDPVYLERQIEALSELVHKYAELWKDENGLPST